MPLYYFLCSDCGDQTRKLLEPSEAKVSPPCKCGGDLKRDPHPPSNQVKETLDNGIMARKVERYSDAEELYRNRARAPTKRE